MNQLGYTSIWSEISDTRVANWIGYCSFNPKKNIKPGLDLG